jgi:ATP-binding cassette subfamily B protein
VQNIFKIIWVSRPHHRLFFILCAIVVAGAAMELVVPIISKSIVDEIVKKIQSPSHPITTLVELVFLSFAVSVATSAVQSVGNRTGSLFADRIKTYLTRMFYEKVLTLPQTYFDNEVSGKIVNQLNRGIVTIGEFFGTASSFILPSFLQAAFTIIVLARYSTPIAILVLILFPGYVYISKFSDDLYRRYQKQMNAIDDVMRGRITEVISNVKLVKGFNNQLEEIRYVDDSMRDINTIHAKQSNVYHSIDFGRNVGLHVILLGINIIVFQQTFRGVLTLGEMVLILQLIAQVRRPLFAMSFVVSQIQNADTGSEQFFELLGLPSTEELPGAQTHNLSNLGQHPTSHSIRFEHVSFEYDTSREVLRDVSFEFKGRETVALVGKSGAGKSTTINLIMRFYEPKRGTIYLNGEPYTHIPHSEIRRHIALVFQENELFSTTIRDNVAYGIQATDEQIWEALRLANADEFVSKLPDALNSQVGERGVKLSGGQKQRVQIARAILKNAPILILDEATSNLDAKSEREVQNALENLMKDKLVLVIAHRFSTLQHVDKIVVLDNGVIVDSGAPKELAQRPGIYADLLRYQIEGNKKLLANYELY